MKRKLTKRNKKFLTSTMGKYVGNRSWQRVAYPQKISDLQDFLRWLHTPRKIQWQYVWVISNKAIAKHLKFVEE